MNLFSSIDHNTIFLNSLKSLKLSLHRIMKRRMYFFIRASWSYRVSFHMILFILIFRRLNLLCSSSLRCSCLNSIYFFFWCWRCCKFLVTSCICLWYLFWWCWYMFRSFYIIIFYLFWTGQLCFLDNFLSNLMMTRRIIALLWDIFWARRIYFQVRRTFDRI